MPYAFRDLIRLAYLLISSKQIEMSGLSGFVPVSDSRWMIYIAAFLALLDVFLLWKIYLLFLGVDQATKVSKRKVFLGVSITIVSLISVQAFGGLLLTMLSDLTVVRPFMF
jgi:hypothetical protein